MNKWRLTVIMRNNCIETVPHNCSRKKCKTKQDEMKIECTGNKTSLLADIM